jgi:hypothetical protein
MEGKPVRRSPRSAGQFPLARWNLTGGRASGGPATELQPDCNHPATESGTVVTGQHTLLASCKERHHRGCNLTGTTVGDESHWPTSISSRKETWRCVRQVGSRSSNIQRWASSAAFVAQDLSSARTRTVVCGHSASRHRCLAARSNKGLAAISRRASPLLYDTVLLLQSNRAAHMSRNHRVIAVLCTQGVSRAGFSGYIDCSLCEEWHRTCLGCICHDWCFVCVGA